MCKWLEETYAWCRKNRPDLVEHLDYIHSRDRAMADDGRAMMLLLSIGFHAGLEFTLRDPETARKVERHEI